MSEINNIPDYLSCVNCGEGTLNPKEKGLCCGHCGATYPIEMGIPILLNESKLLESKKEIQSYYNDESAAYNITHGSDLYGTEYNIETYYQRLFHTYIPNDGRVLEFGAGTGRFSSVFKKMCRELCLTDFSINMLLANLENDLPRICADTEALPFLDGVFDLCIGMTTFSYLPTKSVGLKELWRVIKPGGRLLIIDQNADRAILQLANLYYLRHRRRNRQPQIMESTLPFLTDLFEQSGFDVDDKGYFSWIPHALSKRWVDILRPIDTLLAHVGPLNRYAMRLYITGVKSEQ